MRGSFTLTTDVEAQTLQNLGTFIEATASKCRRHFLTAIAIFTTPAVGLNFMFATQFVHLLMSRKYIREIYTDSLVEGDRDNRRNFEQTVFSARHYFSRPHRARVSEKQRLLQLVRYECNLRNNDQYTCGYRSRETANKFTAYANVNAFAPHRVSGLVRHRSLAFDGLSAPKACAHHSAHWTFGHQQDAPLQKGSATSR